MAAAPRRALVWQSAREWRPRGAARFGGACSIGERERRICRLRGHRPRSAVANFNDSDPFEMSDVDKPLWAPSAEQIADAQMTRFIAFVRERGATDVRDYPSLYDWSVAQREEFWAA